MSAIVPLDSARLTPSASLNRVRLVDLPGIALEPGVRGKTFFELLSSDAVVGLIRAQAKALRLSEREYDDAANLPIRLDLRLDGGDDAVGRAAQAIGRTLARRLAYLILVLRHGDAINRAVRADWDDSYWAHWAAVRQIFLAGGLMSGNLGALMVREVARFLAEHGLTDMTLQRAEYAANLPLIGAARSVHGVADAALVLDFGGSRVKRALAHYRDNELVGLQLLSPGPSGLDVLERMTPEERLPLLGANMVEMLAVTWQQAGAQGVTLAPTVVAGIASYMQANQPLPRQGGLYSELVALSDDVGAWLGERLSERLDWQIDIMLIHDGTAAARACAGEPNSAVILLGTALGVGFPGSDENLHPLAADFAVV